MGHRFGIFIFALMILVFFVKNTACEEENHYNQIDIPMMFQITEQPTSAMQNSIRIEPMIVKLLSLQHFEAAAKNDLSLCKEDVVCLKEVASIADTSCIADTCHATDRTKNPLDCFIRHSGEKDIIKGDQQALGSSLCAVFRAPDDPLKRKEFLHHASSDPWVGENELVEAVAHSLASRDSGEACINYIKNYVGPYDGPHWRLRWYKILAGCRILSNDTSGRAQEKNLAIWHKEGSCSEITDPELQRACEAVGGNLTVEKEKHWINKLIFEADNASEEGFDSPDEKLQVYKETVRLDLNPLSHVYNHVLEYAALKENDTSFCQWETACEKNFQKNTILKRLAERQCDKIPPEIPGQDMLNIPGPHTLCNNLDNCSNLKDGFLIDVCIGLDSGDPDLVKSGVLGIMEKQSGTADRVVSVDHIRQKIALYQGFKQNRSQEVCEIYAPLLTDKYAYLCEVVFSPLPVNEALNTVAKDLALFFLAFKEKDRSYCHHIKNRFVREGCASSEPEHFFGNLLATQPQADHDK